MGKRGQILLYICGETIRLLFDVCRLVGQEEGGLLSRNLTVLAEYLLGTSPGPLELS